MYFSSPEGDSLESGAGEMVVMTPVRASLSIPFGRKGRLSNAQDFWYDFSVDGTLEILSDTARNTLDWADTGALYSHGILVPGEEVTVPFIVCWHVPLREYESGMAKGRIADGGIKIKNHYATEFHDVQDVTDHVSAHIRLLRDKTFTFSDVMVNSSVPKDVLDAAISNLSSLKTNLLMRDERGRIRGYIGLDNDAGCCPGLCQPAWNYAQSMAAVFPSLERNAVNECFTGTFQQDPMSPEGIVLRVYREWKMSGDNAWLGMMWQKVRNALPGKLEEAPGSRGTLYLGALKAYAEMAMVMNAPQEAERYNVLFKKAREDYIDSNWNGHYFFQSAHMSGETNGQPVQVCCSDQLLGQYLAFVSGMGYILDTTVVQTVLESIFRHNFHREMREADNPQRIFAVNGEPGLINCSWPGGNPNVHLCEHSHEVWSGMEYQVAATSVFAGLLEEGMKITSGVRSRYTGNNRNPFAEVESGRHSARALSSWAVYQAMAGYRWDGVGQRMRFTPAVDVLPIRFFWSTATAWGRIEVSRAGIQLECLHGELEIDRLELSGKSFFVFREFVPSHPVKASYENLVLTLDFPEKTVLGEGDEFRMDIP
jgi:uncharacterized protein (DUF608 family)